MPAFRRHKHSRCDDRRAMLDEARALLRAAGQPICPLCNVDPAVVPLAATGATAETGMNICIYCFVDEYARLRVPEMPASWREADLAYLGIFNALRAGGEQVLMTERRHDYLKHEIWMQQALEAVDRHCREQEQRR